MRRGLVVALVVVAACTGSPAAITEPVVPPTSTSAGQTTTTDTSTASTTIATTTSTSTSTTIVPVHVVPDVPNPDPAAPEPGVVGEFSGRGYAVVAAGGADVYPQRGSVAELRAHEGIVLGVDHAEGDWLRVMTPCDEVRWILASEVRLVAAADPVTPGTVADFSDVVIVVDPGHGGPNNIGAVGRGGLPEKVVNVEIARRLRDLLTRPHVIDWETGLVLTGSEIAPAGDVIMTRVAGPQDADYEAGLTFRAHLANAAGASAFVSIHNNAGHEIDLTMPGSDVFYQSQSTESRRLGEIMAEEFQRSFGSFDASWVGAVEVGAKSRLSPRDGETQYYGVLRRTDMPAVIAEGAYLSNPSEEALLRTPRFQQAYAEAVYRALVRFFMTGDTGESLDPIVWAGFAGSGNPTPQCEVPVQP